MREKHIEVFHEYETRIRTTFYVLNSQSEIPNFRSNDTQRSTILTVFVKFAISLLSSIQYQESSIVMLRITDVISRYRIPRICGRGSPCAVPYRSTRLPRSMRCGVHKPLFPWSARFWHQPGISWHGSGHLCAGGA